VFQRVFADLLEMLPAGLLPMDFNCSIQSIHAEKAKKMGKKTCSHSMFAIKKGGMFAYYN